MVVDVCAMLFSCPALLSCPSRLRRSGDAVGGGAADAARRDVASLSGPAGRYKPLTEPPEILVSTVQVEVHSSNSSSGAGSDENLSSSSSDRGSDPGTAPGEHDYEDIYEVRHRASVGVGVGNHQVHVRGKGSKSPSRDSGSHSRSGSMSSTGSGSAGGMGVVNSGTSVVVLHTSTGTTINSPASVTNVTVDGGSNKSCTVITDTSNLMECYEQVGAMTPGMLLTVISIVRLV